MGQFPQQPLHYAGPGLPPVPSGPKQRRGWIIWLICIVAAVVVFLLLSKQAPDRHQRIPLSEFLDQLQLGRVARVVITRDEVVGEFKAAQVVSGGKTVLYFRTQLPESADWNAVAWIVEHRNAATVDVQNDESYVVNILLPWIPWLIIFGLVYLVVVRPLRRRHSTQIIITGLGRWVPDDPGKAAQP